MGVSSIYRRKTRGMNGLEKFATVLALIIFIGLFAAFDAWVLMLLAGAVHLSLWDKVPALDFGQAFLLTLVLAFLKTVISSTFK